MNKRGWVQLSDGKLHFFDAPTEASHCGQQWIDETFTLDEIPTEELPDHTCESCLARLRREQDATKKSKK